MYLLKNRKFKIKSNSFLNCSYPVKKQIIHLVTVLKVLIFREKFVKMKHVPCNLHNLIKKSFKLRKKVLKSNATNILHKWSGQRVELSACKNDESAIAKLLQSTFRSL